MKVKLTIWADCDANLHHDLRDALARTAGDFDQDALVRHHGEFDVIAHEVAPDRDRRPEEPEPTEPPPASE